MSVTIETCRVKRAGPSGDGKIYIELADVNDAKFNGARFFCAMPGREREMLATALAAITSGYNVWVELDSNVEYSNVTKIYLKGA
jgi:hypothetical protein